MDRNQDLNLKHRYEPLILKGPGDAKAAEQMSGSDMREAFEAGWSASQWVRQRGGTRQSARVDPALEIGAGVPFNAPLSQEDRRAIRSHNLSEEKYRAARSQLDACGNPAAPTEW
jgi:hypothetical protein